MSEKKLSLLDKRIEQFFESSTELLTDLHARNKGASNKSKNRGAPKKKRKMKTTISKPNTDIDLPDKEPSGL
jgi:hypothetical protein